MKKLIIIILILMSYCQRISAQPQQISMEEARNAAIIRVANQTSLAKSTITITGVASCENNNGDILMYEIETDKGITVILSGNRKCKPILGVHGNEEGLLLNNYDGLPCGMQFLFDSYKSQINNSFQNHDNESYYIQEWYSLLYDEQIPILRTEGVQPLLSSLWTQQKPNTGVEMDAYNYLMPPAGSCEHCLAGCVAVAMGQVMYYWKYPVLINSREVQFDWCNMTDELYPYSQSYTKNRDAISYLLLECGKSVDMEYGCSSSAAETEDVRDALVDVFNYMTSADYKSRFWHSDDEWKVMLKDDLDSNMPVIYRGKTALIGGKGHSFVCDGYNEYDEFHFNWGWYGYSNPNDFYTLDDLSPNENNYQYYQGAIFNIKPNDNQKICDITLYLNNFYGDHTSHNHPLYTATPRTMTKLISAPSTSPASYRTIPSGATAEYVAHNEIVLNPGFKAEYGSEFTARIEPCAACEEEMTQMEMITGVESANITDTAGYEMRVFMSGDTAILVQRSSLQLYPNPTDNTITVKCTQEINDIRIFDNLGRSVFHWFIESNTDGLLTINVRNIPHGVYILQLTTSDKKLHFGKFVRK